MYDQILIRYGELTTKGKNRMSFIRKLKENVEYQLSDFENVKIKEEYDRMFVELNGENANNVLAKLKSVFGISSYSLVKQVRKDVDSINDFAVKVAQDSSAKTFKVNARRNDKSFGIVSEELKLIVAKAVLQKTSLSVDVRNPELEINVEIRSNGAFIMTSKVQGAGGYPLGIGGKVMLMLSGGIDSPVAAYQLMKKGLTVEFVHFATPPHTTEESLQKVFDLVKILTKYAGTLKVHVVDFTPIQNEIFCSSKDSYRITLMRRFFYRIATQLAVKNGCLAIANGESVGQVASQTLESMNTINEVTNYPVLRPLSMTDKIDIINIAKNIGTYETSIIPHEDCCTLFVPKNPVTKPRVEIAKKEELKMFAEGLTEEAVRNAKKYLI